MLALHSSGVLPAAEMKQKMTRLGMKADCVADAGCNRI